MKYKQFSSDSEMNPYFVACYMDTWSGFEAAKTTPWPSRGLHQRIVTV